MDGSTLDGSVSEGLACKSCVGGLSCGKLFIEQKLCTTNVKAAVEIKPCVSICIPSISEKENVVVSDGGIVTGEILLVQDSDGHSSGSNASSDEDDAHFCKEINMCQELGQSVLMDAKMQKCLSKCSTFPSSKEAHLNSLSTKCQEGLPDVAPAQAHYSSALESPNFTRSMSLPNSKLVSAMKGSRAQNGASPSVELHVKWAPEVYDPPATSMSHTVRSHRYQRPKSKRRDNHKQKHKGKTSKGSGGEGKHANRRNISISNIPSPSDKRLQATGDALLFDEYVKSSVEIMEYAASSQESKCGSSFLREALASMHLSVGEAS